MKTETSPLGALPAGCSRRSALLAIAGAVTQLSACGGGSTDLAGLSSGGTGSFTSGTVTGFGSIIVNGIRYDDSAAALLSTNDTASASALQLGMVVTIEGSSVMPAASTTALPTATATRISYGSEWNGPVSNITATSFDILGHTVDVLASTIFNGSNGTGAVAQLSDLNVRCYAEVYGYVNHTNGRLQASRIEVTAVAPAQYKLSGTITAISGNTAQLGTTALAWNTASVLPSNVSSNAFVRVTLTTTPSGNVWTATRITPMDSPLGSLSSSKDYEAEIQGTITAYTSNASFSVNNMVVNAATAQIAGTLGAGVTVKVAGTIRSGQLIATSVEVKSVTQTETQSFEFYGQVSGVNTTARTFVLRNLTFSYDNNTQFSGVNFTQNPTPMVEVKATPINGVLRATEIDLQT